MSARTSPQAFHSRMTAAWLEFSAPPKSPEISKRTDRTLPDRYIRNRHPSPAAPPARQSLQSKVQQSQAEDTVSSVEATCKWDATMRARWKTKPKQNRR